MQALGQQACTEMTDLGAAVYPAGVPRHELDALPGLYGNIASTEPYMRLYQSLDVPAACVLRDPHHVLVFRQAGATVEILNRACAILRPDVERACTAIFRALPGARRIHMDVPFPPGELELPVRLLFRRDFRVIELPGGPDEYLSSLGKHTRRNLRSYERRWSRDYPDAAVRWVPCAGRSEELFERFCTWKRERFDEKGQASHWDEVEEARRYFTSLLESGGEALVVEVDGEPAGLTFFFHVGETLESQEGASDPRFEPHALGTLMHLWTVLEAARRGCARVCLGPGPNEYFRRFGATPRPAYRVAVFRSSWARLGSLDEAARVGRYRLGRATRATYWRTRHAARGLLRGSDRPPGQG
jgi:CelD/BcsL family acetyltransferase involved in cellulose biosynthesis